MKPRFSHRRIEIVSHLSPAPPVLVPPEVLQKVVDGLIRNAVENTPDEGRIEIAVQTKGPRVPVHRSRLWGGYHRRGPKEDL